MKTYDTPAAADPFARAAAAGRFCLGVALYGAGFLFPQFLQLEHHYSPIRVGIAFLAWTGVSPFVAPIAGQIAQRRGERTTMVAGWPP
jgi:MFS family permease